MPAPVYTGDYLLAYVAAFCKTDRIVLTCFQHHVRFVHVQTVARFARFYTKNFKSIKANGSSAASLQIFPERASVRPIDEKIEAVFSRVRRSDDYNILLSPLRCENAIAFNACRILVCKTCADNFCCACALNRYDSSFV